MEHKENTCDAATSTEANPEGLPCPAVSPTESSQPGLDSLISGCLTDTFAEAARKPRHDGWTPERIGGFLRHLAGSATVEAAAAAVGLSAASAYALRNRRQGRAFARMWDAILVHRSRVRIAAEASSRAVNGVVSRRLREGVVVEELHHHDNRLAMAMLTRLDRLAEREAPHDDHLRALSENLDDYIECIESGGDPDAFVEALRPAPPPEPGGPAEMPGSGRDDFDPLAALGGSRSWRDVPPLQIPVADLEYEKRAEWTDDQWMRARRSGFLTWSASAARKEATSRPLDPATAAFMRKRAWVATRKAMAEAGEEAVSIEDLDPDAMTGWTSDQWERAHQSGLLRCLPDEVWLEEPEPASQGSCQSSTSSTSSGGEEEGG